MAKYGPIWEIIDHRWNNQLHHPIHVADLEPKVSLQSSDWRRFDWGGKKWLV